MRTGIQQVSSKTTMTNESVTSENIILELVLKKV